MEIKKLIKIGQKIDSAIKAIKNVGLNEKEIEEFENYIRQQETISPLINPTNYREISKMLDLAKTRIELLKPIIELEEPDVNRVA